jgi:hypothetical protein
MTLRRQNPSPTLGEHCVPSPDAKTRSGAEGGSSKRHFYRPLPKEFRHDGFEYHQTAREGSAAIYEQIWNGCGNAAVCYEVVLIWRRKGFQIGDRFVEPAEVYPNSEGWGVDGWTAEDKQAAFRKLQTLVVERARTFRAKRSAAVSSHIESE